MKNSEQFSESTLKYPATDHSLNLAEDEIPGTKFLLKGSTSLSDAELLSIIICPNSTFTSKMASKFLALSRRILSEFNNNLPSLWKSTVSELQFKTGISRNSALKISALFELSRRKQNSESISRESINSSQHAHDILKSKIGDLPYEEFWVILLNKANKVLRLIKLSEGGQSGTVVDPKKLFELVLSYRASSIILGHNHPSGNIKPSEADMKITQKIKNAGILLEIPVLDHIIIADDRYYSFADEGQL